MSGLPGGWAATTFAEVADVQLGKMLDRTKNRGEPTPYLRNINVRWGSFQLNDLAEMRMTPEDRRTFVVRDGDLMVCEGGEPGRAAVWRGEETSVAYQKALMRVRPHDGIEPTFLQAFLKHEAEAGNLSEHFTGTTIKHLPQNALRSLRLHLPPSSEQRRMVAKLDALTARTARARSELRRVTALLEGVPRLLDRLDQAVLAKAFRGELVPQDPADEPAAVLLDRLRAAREAAPKPKRGRKAVA